jgi:hypothetical protein
MQIDPITSFSSRAAANASQRILEYYYEMSAKRLAGGNYLRELGSIAKQLDVAHARNAELFEKFRQRSIGR